MPHKRDSLVTNILWFNARLYFKVCHLLIVPLKKWPTQVYSIARILLNYYGQILMWRCFQARGASHPIHGNITPLRQVRRPRPPPMPRPPTTLVKGASPEMTYCTRRPPVSPRCSMPFGPVPSLTHPVTNGPPSSVTWRVPCRYIWCTNCAVVVQWSVVLKLSQSDVFSADIQYGVETQINSDTKRKVHYSLNLSRCAERCEKI